MMAVAGKTGASGMGLPAHSWGLAGPRGHVMG